MSTADLIVVGRVGAPYGVKGWVHVQSYTSPYDNILAYAPWFVRKNDTQTWQPVTDLECRRHKQAIVARLNDTLDRDAATKLRGFDIAVKTSCLPAPNDPDEYYWKDLLDAQVINVQGQQLGHVDHLLETGMHDVLAVVLNEPDAKAATKECLIPFVAPYVVAVDLAANVITVDWDPSW